MNKSSIRINGRRARNGNCSKNGFALRHAKRHPKAMAAYCGLAGASLLLIGAPTRPLAAATITWNGSASQLWSNPANWTPTGTPGSGSYQTVVIGSPASSATPAQDDYSTSVNSLTINSGAVAEINPGVNLTINSAGYIANDGTFTVNSTGGNQSTGIGIQDSVEIKGTGAIVLNANGGGLNAAEFHDAGYSNLTQDAGHTIEGTGQINVDTFTNNGTVNANSSGNTLLLLTNSAAYTNNSLMEATSGGTLEESGTTINQGANGLIEANGGNVLLNGGTISGGTLTSLSGSEIDEQNVTNLVNVTISSGSNLYVIAGQNLVLNNGNSNDLITNNGTITVNKGGTNTATGIGIANSVELAGTGAIVLNANGGGLNAAEFYDVGYSNLTQDAGHTIEGTGQINVDTFTNNGTVNANSSGHTLLLLTNSAAYTNNSLMEATGGGTLGESGTTINQGTNGLIEANGGNVLLNGGTISGGTLTSLSGSEIDEQGGTNLVNLTISSGSNLYVIAGQNLVLNNGNSNDLITNNGTITVNKGGGNQSTGIGIQDSVELAGTGAIVLNANGGGLNAAEFYDVGYSNLTQDAGQTIEGTGQINVDTFTNNGTVNANSSGHTLLLNSHSQAYTNNSLMEATSGGTLEESGTTINQGANGLIEANGGNVLLNGGTISGGTLTSAGTSEIDEQGNTSLAGVTVSSGSNLYVLDGNTLFLNSTTLTNNGTITVNKGGSNQSTATRIGIQNSVELAGTGAIVLNANGNGLAAAEFYDAGYSNLTQDAGHTIEGTGQIVVNTFANNGTVNANSSGNTLLLQTSSVAYTNNGTYEASNGGTLTVTALANDSASTLTGGTYEVTANSTMNLPATITTNNADIILSGTNTTFAAIAPLNNNEGGFHLLNGATFTTAGALTNSGTIETAAALSTLNITGAFTQTAGMTMDNGIINNSATMQLLGGTLAGTGILSGGVYNTGGTISPGDAPGTLTVGALTQGSGGSLDILLASLSSYDQLDVTGLASIAGTLDVTLAGGFSAPNG